MASSSGNGLQLGEYIRQGQWLHFDDRESLLTSFRVLVYISLALSPPGSFSEERTHHGDEAQIPVLFQVVFDAPWSSPRRLTDCLDE